MKLTLPEFSKIYLGVPKSSDDSFLLMRGLAKTGNLGKLSGEEAWEAIENFAQGQKEWDNPPNIISEQEVENSDPQSTPQVLPSFEEYASPVTCPEEVEDTLGTSIEPQPQPLPNCPPLDKSLRDKRGLEPPIKPHSSDSFRMKEVDHLTNHTPPLPHMASLHPKDTYCYYHPCIGDPKKHYGFKPGLLRHNGSLGVDFSKLEMIEDDLELEYKEVYFLGRGLNSPVRPKEVEKVRIKETRHLEHIIQQPIF
ncbi:hypothetical protein Tco_0223985 [Tanacetum coccineum]